MSGQLASCTRIFCAVLASCALGLLVTSVTVHGDNLYDKFAQAIGQVQVHATAPRVTTSPGLEGGGGLDLVECMCGYTSYYGIGGWLGLWVVTVIFGGLPTAVLLRASKR